MGALSVPTSWPMSSCLDGSLASALTCSTDMSCPSRRPARTLTLSWSLRKASRTLAGATASPMPKSIETLPPRALGSTTVMPASLSAMRRRVFLAVLIETSSFLAVRRNEEASLTLRADRSAKTTDLAFFRPSTNSLISDSLRDLVLAITDRTVCRCLFPPDRPLGGPRRDKKICVNYRRQWAPMALRGLLPRWAPARAGLNRSGPIVLGNSVVSTGYGTYRGPSSHVKAAPEGSGFYVPRERCRRRRFYGGFLCAAWRLLVLSGSRARARRRFRHHGPSPGPWGHRPCGR